MVPEYIDIPVVLLAQKFKDNKIKKKRATHKKKIYNYLCGLRVDRGVWYFVFFVWYFGTSYYSSFGSSYSSFGELYRYHFSFHNVLLFVFWEKEGLNFFGGKNIVYIYLFFEAS